MLVLARVRLLADFTPVPTSIIIIIIIIDLTQTWGNLICWNKKKILQLIHQKEINLKLNRLLGEPAKAKTFEGSKRETKPFVSLLSSGVSIFCFFLWPSMLRALCITTWIVGFCRSQHLFTLKCYLCDSLWTSSFSVKDLYTLWLLLKL